MQKRWTAQEIKFLDRKPKEDPEDTWMNIPEGFDEQLQFN